MLELEIRSIRLHRPSTDSYVTILPSLTDNKPVAVRGVDRQDLQLATREYVELFIKKHYPGWEIADVGLVGTGLAS